MPARSLKQVSTSLEGYITENNTVRWTAEDIDDKTSDVVAQLEKLPPGTKLKLSQVQTVHIIEGPEDEHTDANHSG